ncbi:MAG: hypothetical protein ABI970_12215, partial [Chloroflexota bacterium]
MMKKFKLAVLIVLSLTLMGISTVVHAQAKEVTLTARTHDQLYLDYFNSRTADFDKAHPDLKITYDFQVDSAVATTTL